MHTHTQLNCRSIMPWVVHSNIIVPGGMDGSAGYPVVHE